MSYWPNFILTKTLLLNVILTKCHNEKKLFCPMSFWQMSFWTNVILTKCHFDQMSFWPMSFWPNVILTKCHFDQMLFWPNVILTKCHFDQMSLWLNVSLTKIPFTKCQFTKNSFHQMSFWQKFFSPNVILSKWHGATEKWVESLSFSSSVIRLRPLPNDKLWWGDEMVPWLSTK